MYTACVIVRRVITALNARYKKSVLGRDNGVRIGWV